eukprot:2092035-Alexandrium_andersonii.AAC.1
MGRCAKHSLAQQETRARGGKPAKSQGRQRVHTTPLAPRAAPSRRSGRGCQGAHDTPSAQTRTEPQERPR